LAAFGFGVGVGVVGVVFVVGVVVVVVLVVAVFVVAVSSLPAACVRLARPSAVATPADATSVVRSERLNRGT
jgi:uncharacterized membrane protein